MSVLDDSDVVLNKAELQFEISEEWLIELGFERLTTNIFTMNIDKVTYNLLRIDQTFSSCYKWLCSINDGYRLTQAYVDNHKELLKVLNRYQE